jgi:hypothetical protein
MLSLDLHLVEPTRQLRDDDAFYSTRLLRGHLRMSPDSLGLGTVATRDDPPCQ